MCELENNLSKSSIFGVYILEDGDTLNCGGGRYVRSYVISDKVTSPLLLKRVKSIYLVLHGLQGTELDRVMMMATSRKFHFSNFLVSSVLALGPIFFSSSLH